MLARPGTTNPPWPLGPRLLVTSQRIRLRAQVEIDAATADNPFSKDPEVSAHVYEVPETGDLEVIRQCC
ncbi:hypothetical protein GCM10028796_54950 [Ramlibacter monticola]